MMELSYQDIKLEAQNLFFKGQAFINGKYVNAQSGKTYPNLNPATGKILTEVSACNQLDVDLAVRSARSAFENGVWAKRSPAERKTILLKLADLMEAHQFTLALLETLDTGKPIKESMQIDLPCSIRCIRWYAELIDKVYGQVAPTQSDVLAYITREPLGVVGAITPWNYPLYLACVKLSPALVAGNSLILKPAEQAPLTSIYLAELATIAGVPDGVINVLPGFGEEAGKALGLHPDVDGVGFTGSTEVGKLLLKYSADSNMKRVFLECGGKSPNIILADCLNLDKAAEASIVEAFFNQGEVCCAPTRLLVEEKIRDECIKKLLLYAKNFYPNDPLDPETNMGALIDKMQMQRVLHYIARGHDEGAHLILGGNRIKEQSGGYFVEPTIFDGVDNSMTIAREEVFGPILSIITFKNLAEAVSIANDTHYGLSASVWTQNLQKAHYLSASIRAGVISINCINSADITTPFGGFKQSGFGRELSLHALDHYTEVKTTWINLAT